MKVEDFGSNEIEELPRKRKGCAAMTGRNQKFTKGSFCDPVHLVFLNLLAESFQDLLEEAGGVSTSPRTEAADLKESR